ncbi:MAG TPA: hypothetical protein VNO30_37300 [Kofleriaceae bacterium]|nr:hypothetical protein [Kofleriaceae bacterium]
MRGAVEGYVRTVIAGADADTIAELRQILTMSDRMLEEYRPLGCYFGEGYPDSTARENALENLIRRHPSIEQICRAVEGWALWYRDETIEHNIPPINRLATIAWLTHVALPEESAPMRTRNELVAALEALGWKLIDGPKQTFGEWKATVQRGAASMLTTGATELGVLRYLLKLAEDHAKRGS